VHSQSTARQNSSASHVQTLLVATIVCVGSTTAAANDAVSESAATPLPSHYRLIEGDIMVSEHSELPSSRSVTASDRNKLWPDGVVPYLLDPALSADNLRSIKQAIDHWNAISTITLIDVNSKELSADNARDHLQFIPGDFCASWVGRRGYAQELWVAPNCSKGSIMHEIGHALGLEHEHTRHDRNDYITILWDNIQPARLHNFDAAPAGSRMLGSYDYDSIMHYGSDNFSRNGKPTIVVKGDENRYIGQRNAPSRGDLSSIGELYSSDLSIVTQSYQASDGSNIEVFVTNEAGQGAHDINVVVSAASTDALSVTDAGNWHCENASAAKVICSLNRLSGGARESIRIHSTAENNAERAAEPLLADASIDSARPQDSQNAITPVKQAYEQAYVQSKTLDHDMSNNGNIPDTFPSLGPDLILVPENPIDDVLVEDSTSDHSVAGGGRVSYYFWGVLLLLIAYRKTRFGIDDHEIRAV